jgi:hypothetical protein
MKSHKPFRNSEEILNVAKPSLADCEGDKDTKPFLRLEIEISAKKEVDGDDHEKPYRCAVHSSNGRDCKVQAGSINVTCVGTASCD